MKKIVLLLCGFVMLGIGAVGVFLPILPTTPFIIIAAACFSASSPAIYKKLQRSPFFGPYIKGIRDRTPIPKHTRIQGIIALWVLLTISAVIVRSLAVIIILAVVGVAVTTHLLLIRR
jgi:uncharacterized membrane protein YbaN (DUF454 family)